MSLIWSKPKEWEDALEPIGMTEFFRDNMLPETIDDVMSNGNWEVIFYQYAKACYVTESVDFLRAVRVFESSGDLDQARQIYEQFIVPGSPKEVNIPATKRKPLTDIFGPGGEGFGPPSMFDESKYEITLMLKNDILPRFKSSAKNAQDKLGEAINWDDAVGEGRGRSEAVAKPADFVPAGWHTDPSGRHELRYWDGSDWTDHVSDQGKTATNPL